MTKVLVTGATGTIGSRVLRQLAERAGIGVRAGVRSPERVKTAGVEAVRFDYEEPATLSEAFAGVDRVFLLTPFVEEPAPLVEAALAAAKQAGVEFVLRMSAAGADPQSDFALARHHGEGEEAVKASGIDWSIIRPTFFMDNLINFAGQTIANEGAFYGAAGEGATSYVSSHDVAAAAAAILVEPAAHVGKTYELTGPEALTNPAVAAIIAAATGKEVRYVDLPPEKLRAGMEAQGMPGWVIDGMVGLENVKAQGWAAQVSPHVQELAGESETFAAFAARRKSDWLG